MDSAVRAPTGLDSHRGSRASQTHLYIYICIYIERLSPCRRSLPCVFNGCMPGSTESGLASQSQVGGGRGTSKVVQCPRVEVEGHKYDCGKLARVLIWSSRGLQKLPRVLVWSSQAPPRAGTRSRLAVSRTGKFILVSVCVCVCERAVRGPAKFRPKLFYIFT